MRATRDDFFAVQRLCVALGFIVTEDGLWGPETRNAVYGALRAATEPSPLGDPETDKLLEELSRDEGTVLQAYQDSLGYWTIGTGRLIDKRRGGGITKAEADYLLANDVQKIGRASCRERVYACV